MSVELLGVVLNHSRAKGTDKVVLIGIANHEGDGGSFPKIGTLARYANVTERAVQSSISKLVQLGELAVYRQEGGRRNMPDFMRPNRYEVLVRCPINCDRTAQHRPVDNPQDTNQGSLPGVDNVRSDRVKQTSPGEADFTGPGEADFTPEPSFRTNPLLTVVSTGTDPRAREAARPVDSEIRRQLVERARAALRGEA